MPKTNFTKVEDSLTAGLRKMEVNHLLNKADEATKGSKSAEAKTKGQIFSALQFELKYLLHHGEDLYEKLKINKAELEKLGNNPEAIPAKEWEMIKNLKEVVDSYKKEWDKKHPAPTDESLVEQERKKHVYKRFNTNEKWLPLK